MFAVATFGFTIFDPEPSVPAVPSFDTAFGLLRMNGLKYRFPE
jgi:hypothetical protein